MIRLVIPGNPIAKKRPRFARRGKFVTTYNPQETEEGRFAIQAIQQIAHQDPGEPISGPISLRTRFDMPIPKSTSKKRATAMLCGNENHVKKPDLDNLLKFVKDCLNRIAWKDDSQVCMIEAYKRYSEHPKTIIEIEEIS